MLGVSVASDLSWNEHISFVAKSAARKIDLLFRSRRFFKPLQLLTFYNAQIFPCLKYGSHLWRGSSTHSLATLDAIQNQAIRLIHDPTLIASLDSLAHRSVSPLSLFNRYYLNLRIPTQGVLFRSPSFANTFVFMTSRNWNSLPASVFPGT